jgi:hypothetical protein
MADQWIFSFRKTGCRDLTESEQNELRRLARRQSWIRFGWGSVCVLLAIIGFSGIAIAADRSSWGWAVLVVAFIAFCWVMGYTNRAERLSLLFRRAARVGRVDRYEREKRDAEVWAKYRRDSQLEDDEHSPQPSIYWEADEKFEEQIKRGLNEQPNSIETPADDDVVIAVEGRFVSTVIDVPVLHV